jgi:hypothetical protein
MWRYTYNLAGLYETPVLAEELPGREEAERLINPLLASAERLVALDARVVLHGPEVKEEELPRLAILPYPVKYVERWRMKEREVVVIRRTLGFQIIQSGSVGDNVVKAVKEL